MRKDTSQYSLSVVSPRLADEWHPTKNGKLTPRDFVAGSHKKAWWVCNKGHAWEACIRDRSTSNCPYCSNKKVCKDNCLATVNPKLAREWHPTKNGKLTPNDVVNKSNKKVWWQCEKGHEWQANIDNRSRGAKCCFCTNKKVHKDNCLATVNPKLANEWHPTKNGEFTPNSVLSGAKKKAWWLCEKGHEWQAGIADRNKRGDRCPYCAGQKVCKDNCLAAVNPRLASEWNPLKNGRLTANDVTSGSGTKVWWLCKKGHEWQTKVNDRNNRNNCPFCAGQVSLRELRVYAEIKHFFSDVVLRKKTHDVECDIFIPSINFAIEYDGFYWHKNKADRDKRKNKKLEQAGVFLLRIREKGLEKIGEDDISCLNQNMTFGIMEKVLKVITNRVGIPKIDSKKLKEYLSNRIFVNEEEFVTLFDILPDPLPETSLQETNPELAREWHPTKNGKLTPNSVTYGSGRKVWWKGMCGHEWEMQILSRSHGQGCPFCTRRRVSADNCLAAVNPKLASEWHPTKNDSLTANDVVAGSNRKVWWQCKKDHEWQAAPNTRSRGHGCPYCWRRKVASEIHRQIMTD